MDVMNADHPDQDQDMGMIAEKLIPLLEALATRLEAVEDRLNGCEEMITKIVTGFTGAANNQRRSKLMESVSSTYGEKLGKIKPIYQKLVGEDRDPIGDLVEAVMEARGQEGYDPNGEADLIQNIFEQIESKFGIDSLKKLTESIMNENPDVSQVEIEVKAGEVPEDDPIEKMKRDFKKAPKLKF